MSQHSTRHHAREVALQLLYRYDVANLGAQTSQSALAQEIATHFDHFKVAQELREFVAQLVAGSLLGITELDGLIEKHAANWKLGRMGYVDRSILRMAAYELQNFPETASSIVINEAVELAKQFGTNESAGFVNGILDAIKTTVKKPA